MPSGVYQHKSRKPKVSIVCLNCRKVFIAPIYKKRKFCSSHCWAVQVSKTRVWTEETREKLREAKIGLPPNNAGMKGEMAAHWLGGKSFESYGIEFNNQLKEQIRERDNFRCQECFRHQNELHSQSGKKYKLLVHHIDYNKKNNNPINLLSLCRNCHTQTNYGREDWTNYFNQKVEKDKAIINSN